MTVAGWDESTFTFDGRTYPTYRRGTGPGVIVVHEIPGITPKVEAFANEVVDAGFTVVMPSLLGTPGVPQSLGPILKAVKKVFGDHAYKLAVSSTKSSTGHLLGAAGGLEAGILALAIKHQILPATINLDEADPEADLDFVPHVPRPTTFEYALTNSFGFGGTNGALILRRYAG